MPVNNLLNGIAWNDDNRINLFKASCQQALYAPYVPYKDYLDSSISFLMNTHQYDTHAHKAQQAMDLWKQQQKISQQIQMPNLPYPTMKNPCYSISLPLEERVTVKGWDIVGTDDILKIVNKNGVTMLSITETEIIIGNPNGEHIRLKV